MFFNIFRYKTYIIYINNINVYFFFVKLLISILIIITNSNIVYLLTDLIILHKQKNPTHIGI